MVIQKTEEVKVKKMSPKIDRSRPQNLWLLFCLFFTIIKKKTSSISVSKYVNSNKNTFEICESVSCNILIYTLENFYTGPKIYNPKIFQVFKTIFKFRISLRSCLRTQSFHSIHKYLVTHSDRGIFLLRLRKI